MTAPAEYVTDVCGDCDGSGYIDDVDEDDPGAVLRADCITCDGDGFVEVPAEEDDDV